METTVCKSCETRAEIMAWVADKLDRLREQTNARTGAPIHDKYTRATLTACWHSLTDSPLIGDD